MGGGIRAQGGVIRPGIIPPLLAQAQDGLRLRTGSGSGRAQGGVIRPGIIPPLLAQAHECNKSTELVIIIFGRYTKSRKHWYNGLSSAEHIPRKLSNNETF
jgi:hypothetical protein